MIILETKTKEQELLKAYLEGNASETLIDKINNGVKIVKDGKTLISKKTLETFMSYATEQAKKQAEQGAKCAMVEDAIVFGWLIHYFQEDSIEGILYNEDGTEYKPTVKKKEVKPKAEPKPKSNVGEVISMFEGMEDVLTPKNPLENLKSNIITFPSGDYLHIGYDNGIIYAGAMTNTEILRQYEFEYEHDLSVDKNIQDIYEYILEKEPKYASKPPVMNIDKETGEVLEQYEFDIEIAAKLYEIFGDDLEGC
ncbi:MAG: hypothetical protein J6A53_06430 [Clostridia bacterium]|nr:hypothetical protein [Clostridia bacterium]